MLVLPVLALMALTQLSASPAPITTDAFRKAFPGLLGKSYASMNTALGKGKKSSEPPMPGFLQYEYQVKGLKSVSVLFRKSLKESVWVRVVFADPIRDWKDMVSDLGFAGSGELSVSSGLSGSHRRSVTPLKNLHADWVLRVYNTVLIKEVDDELRAQRPANQPMAPFVPPVTGSILLYNRKVNLA